MNMSNSEEEQYRTTISVQITPKEHFFLRRQARKNKMSFGNYVIVKALQAAEEEYYKETIEEEEAKIYSSNV